MVNNCSEISGVAGFGLFIGSVGLWCVLALFSLILLFSLSWNILCCVQKTYRDRGSGFLPRFRRSVSLKHREMEENPIYGNITYKHSDIRKEEQQRPPEALSPGRDCYANLSLKVPRVGRSSPLPQIQYSDVLVTCDEEDERKQAEKDSCSLLSDLYASVDSEHVKNKKLQSDEEYANHAEL